VDPSSPRTPRVALPFGVGTPEDKRQPYRAALRQAGIEPVEPADTLDGFDGLLLAGGSDVDPALYSQQPSPETQPSDPVRDRLELALLRQALDRDLPVLGICRGLQLANVALGGALRQHVEGHNHRKVRDAHPVTIAPGTRLAGILGPGEYLVNSRHHQCADAAAAGLTVAALAPDGVIEALELPQQRFFLAVQWHPEARIDGPDARLFAAFRAAMA
jgi:gamma-glutamyl-gamma-aminobutyrate hydrolase PuuD